MLGSKQNFLGRFSLIKIGTQLEFCREIAEQYKLLNNFLWVIRNCIKPVFSEISVFSEKVNNIFLLGSSWLKMAPSLSFVQKLRIHTGFWTIFYELCGTALCQCFWNFSLGTEFLFLVGCFDSECEINQELTEKFQIYRGSGII